MIHDPAISIIVAVYKTEKYISRCLESLINQTFRDIEIICVNDGSPDNAQAICEYYAQNDERFVLLSQSNQGLSAARNTGLLHARGKYIQFCDSDDFYELTMCEKMYNAIVTSNSDIVTAGTNVLYEDLPILPPQYDDYFKVKFIGLRRISCEIFQKTDVCVWNKIFIKETLDKYAIRFPLGLINEDVAFSAKYFFVAKYIFYLNEPLYNYVRRIDSVMYTSVYQKNPKALDHVLILYDVQAFMKKYDLTTGYNALFAWMVVANTNLAHSFGTEDIHKEIFNNGVELLKEIDFNECMTWHYHRDDLLRLFALKKNDPEMYFSVERYNSEYQQTKNEVFRLNEKLTEIIQESRQLRDQIAQINNEYERFTTIHATTFDKRLKDGLLKPTLRAFLIFPWQIYKSFCMVYNNPLPKRSLKLLIKSYLFFPYYTLKAYNTLLIRKNELTEN